MIEDDEELAMLLKHRLLSDDIDVTVALTPLCGLELLKENPHYEILILDLSLPQMDGLEICRVVRQELSIPIIISSARSGVDDKVIGFERGADDFIAKPYDPIELVARIKAIVRRSQPHQAAPKTIFTLNNDRREVLKEGVACHLTAAEYEITAYFIEKEGGVVSREELLLNIAAIKYESGLKSIDVIIGRIRHKIGDDSKNPRFITPVRGIGYRFNNA